MSEVTSPAPARCFLPCAPVDLFIPGYPSYPLTIPDGLPRLLGRLS